MKRLRLSLLFVALLLLGNAASALAQNLVYAKFGDGSAAWTGPLTGPPGREGWFQIDSCNIAVNNPATLDGGGLQPGQPSADPILVIKRIDRLSPTIFGTLVSGQLVPSAGGGNPSVVVEYEVDGTVRLRLEFKGVLFTKTAAELGEEIPTESVSFKITSMRMTSITPPSDTVTRSWNFLLQNPSF